MITINRDHTYGRGDLYTIKLSEPGFGVRAMKFVRATLQEAQMAIAHYYEPGDRSHDRDGCLVCKALAEQRAKQAKRERRGAPCA